MKKYLIQKLISVALVCVANVAVAQDLELPGERWLAQFDKFICAAFEDGVEEPTALAQYNVQFKTLTTDKTLDNALLKASFEDQGVVCSYSLILLADNNAQTSQYVDSKAFNVEDGDEAVCAAGKKVLDEAFAFTKYLYYGHPHNLAFMLPGVGSEDVCGAGKTTVGANFVVRGLLRK